MNTNLPDQPAATPPSPKSITLKVIAVGGPGVKLMEPMIGRLGATGFVAVDTDPQSLAASSAPEKVLLETKTLRGLGTSGDPHRGCAIAEEHLPKLKSLCQGADAVFILTGLGGGAGTGISPVLARAARENGALVLGFAALPFACEGPHRQRLALRGLDEFKSAADGVICLPNEKVLKLTDESTSVLETFRLANDLLADGLRGVWCLLSHKGLIELHFDRLCRLLRDRHAESAFAVAEAMGATRSREVTDKLLAHPLLESGKVLAESDAVLVSLMGGPDLTMAEVNRVMEQLNSQCKRAQVIMGAAVDESFRDRLAVTLIAARKTAEPETDEAASSEDVEGRADAEIADRTTPARPGSRLVPPPPSLSVEQVEQLMARNAALKFRSRKSPAKMRQGQLPLEIVSKGRFDKSEPTIHKGQDLDVPTYLRRGVSLN